MGRIKLFVAIPIFIVNDLFAVPQREGEIRAITIIHLRIVTFPLGPEILKRWPKPFDVINHQQVFGRKGPEFGVVLARVEQHVGDHMTTHKWI